MRPLYLSVNPSGLGLYIFEDPARANCSVRPWKSSQFPCFNHRQHGGNPRFSIRTCNCFRESSVPSIDSLTLNADSIASTMGMARNGARRDTNANVRLGKVTVINAVRDGGTRGTRGMRGRNGYYRKLWVKGARRHGFENWRCYGHVRGRWIDATHLLFLTDSPYQMNFPPL